MKNVTIMIIAVTLLFGSVMLSAGPALANSPQQALQTDKQLQNTIQRYSKSGYDMVEQFENQFRYFAEPTETYIWGEGITRMKKAAGSGSLQVDYVTITATIECVMENGIVKGYRVTGVNVEEYTVY